MLIDSNFEYTFNGITFKFSANLTPLVNIASLLNAVGIKAKKAVEDFLRTSDLQPGAEYISLTELAPFIQDLGDSEIEFRFNAFLSDVYVILHKKIAEHFNTLRAPRYYY